MGLDYKDFLGCVKGFCIGFWSYEKIFIGLKDGICMFIFVFKEIVLLLGVKDGWGS